MTNSKIEWNKIALYSERRLKTYTKSPESSDTAGDAVDESVGVVEAAAAAVDDGVDVELKMKS